MSKSNGKAHMEIVHLSPDKLKPYFRNPRKKNDAVRKVAESIQNFGWRQPIVVDKDMTVVVGHTRLEAARKLNLETIPVHVARDLTPEQAKAYRIADNRTNEETEWDPELLSLELRELVADGLGEWSGFDSTELEWATLDPDEFEPASEGNKSLDQLGSTHTCPKCGHEFIG